MTAEKSTSNRRVILNRYNKEIIGMDKAKLKIMAINIIDNRGNKLIMLK